METKENIRNTFQTLKTIYNSVIVIYLFLIFIVYSFKTDNKILNTSKEILVYIDSLVIVLTICCIIFGYYIYKKIFSGISELSIDEKLHNYRKAVLLKLGSFDFAAFTNLVIYFLTGSVYIINLLLIVMLIFLLNKPTLRKFVEESELNEEEQMYFNENEHL